jgi:DHA2 family multidrug resistance protein
MPPRERAPVHKWVVAGSISFGSLMATIDSSIVNVATPAIRGELGASLQDMTWVATGYMIAMVLVMPLTGLLSALIGQKRLYLASLALFTIGSLLCAQAHTLEALIAFRVLQGFGGGALQPTQQAILRQTFPPHEQGMAMAMFAMVIMLGPAVGPVLGGWIVDTYHWPWIFYINLPVGLVGIFLTWRNVHDHPDVVAANRARSVALRANFDWAGLALMTITVAAMQYFFEEGAAKDWFSSEVIRVTFFVTIVGATAFVIRELSATAPIVNLRLLRDTTFLSGTVVATVMFGMLMGSMFLLPVFTQEILHFPATLAGLVLMPRTLAMMAVSPIIGRIYNRVPPALIVGFGVVLFAFGNYELSHVTLQTSGTDLIFPLIITGAAFACLFVPLTTAALSRIPRHEIADAAGLNSFFRQIGGSVGLTIFANMFTTYAANASDSLRAHVTVLRPEVAQTVAAMKAGLLGRGLDPAAADAMTLAGLRGKVLVQGTVIGFDKAFLLQGIAFLAIIPILFFLRVDRSQPAPHVEMPAE